MYYIEPRGKTILTMAIGSKTFVGSIKAILTIFTLVGLLRFKKWIRRDHSADTGRAQNCTRGRRAPKPSFQPSAPPRAVREREQVVYGPFAPGSNTRLRDIAHIAS